MQLDFVYIPTQGIKQTSHTCCIKICDIINMYALFAHMNSKPAIQRTSPNQVTLAQELWALVQSFPIYL